MNITNLESGRNIQFGKRNIFVKVIGKGPLLVMIHGGPGLDHTYLPKWFQEISKIRTLVFFDQLGCGSDQTPLDLISAEDTVNQAGNLLDHINEIFGNTDVGVLTHSWGSYIILSLLKMKKYPLRELILVSPMGLTRSRFDESGDRLVSRIPEKVFSLIGQLELETNPESGIKMMEAALPYYVGSVDRVPDIRFGSYKSKVYDQVVSTLDDFDFTNMNDKLPNRTLLIYGDNDFELPKDTYEFANKSSITIKTIQSSGHFPFAEMPDRFNEALKSFLIDNYQLSNPK